MLPADNQTYKVETEDCRNCQDWKYCPVKQTLHLVAGKYKKSMKLKCEPLKQRIQADYFD